VFIAFTPVLALQAAAIRREFEGSIAAGQVTCSITGLVEAWLESVAVVQEAYAGQNRP